jgi:hypothetical protein
MAQFSAPFGGNPSQEITPPHIKSCAHWIVITNTGAVQVWVSDDKNALDGGAANNAGIPQTGHVLQPGLNPIAFGKVKASLFLLAAGPGGQIECTAYPDF